LRVLPNLWPTSATRTPYCCPQPFSFPPSTI
jgi:hypothetical protein